VLYITICDLLIATIIQITHFAKDAFTKKFIFIYKKVKTSELEYVDQDAICYTSYFIIRYLKNNGFKIYRKMAAPVTNIKAA